jgi:hypothetical protein
LQFAAANCYLRLHIEKEDGMKEGLYNERVDVPRTGTRPDGRADRRAAGGPRPASGPPPAAGRPWKAFTLLVVTYFITIVDFTIVNVALPTIGRELRFPESDLQWLVTAYGLTFAGFLLLGGRAADLLGRRRVLMAGLAVFTASSLAGGLAGSDTFLIVMRGIQGLGAALVLPAALSIVTNMFAEGPERNKALGICSTPRRTSAGRSGWPWPRPSRRRTPGCWPSTATRPRPRSPAGSSGPWWCAG